MVATVEVDLVDFDFTLTGARVKQQLTLSHRSVENYCAHWFALCPLLVHELRQYLEVRKLCDGLQ